MFTLDDTQKKNIIPLAHQFASPKSLSHSFTPKIFCISLSLSLQFHKYKGIPTNKHSHNYRTFATPGFQLKKKWLEKNNKSPQSNIINSSLGQCNVFSPLKKLTMKCHRHLQYMIHRLKKLLPQKFYIKEGLSSSSSSSSYRKGGILQSHDTPCDQCCKNSTCHTCDLCQPMKRVQKNDIYTSPK